MHIELKHHPELLRVIRAADGRYKKHKAFFSVSETATLGGTYWDGGSRSTYTAVDILSGRSKGAPQYAPAASGGPRQAPTVSIPPGVAIVETGYSCGKVATASVTINPADAAKLLPHFAPVA